jgi:hypothetical protein
MNTAVTTRTIEFDKVTSTNLCYFETNDPESFEIIINFLYTVNTFHTKLDCDFKAKHSQAEIDARALKDEGFLTQKFEIEVVHRYLNTILLDGEYNREDNIKIMLGFYETLNRGDRDLITLIDHFAKQIPITTDSFSSIVLDEQSYNKVMDLFTGDSYLTRIGFNQSIIMASKLLHTLRNLIGMTPSTPNLFMYYLGTRFF